MITWMVPYKAAREVEEISEERDIDVMKDIAMSSLEGIQEKWLA